MKTTGNASSASGGQIIDTCGRLWCFSAYNLGYAGCLADTNDGTLYEIIDTAQAESPPPSRNYFLSTISVYRVHPITGDIYLSAGGGAGGGQGTDGYLRIFRAP